MCPGSFGNAYLEHWSDIRDKRLGRLAATGARKCFSIQTVPIWGLLHAQAHEDVLSPLPAATPMPWFLHAYMHVGICIPLAFIEIIM